MKHEGRLDAAGMDEAMLDVIAAHLPYAEDGELKFTLSFEDWEAVIDEEDATLPEGVEEAAFAVLEIANAYPQNLETWRAYRVDLQAPSATERALKLQELPGQALAARRRVEALLRKNRKGKALRAFLSGLEKAASQTRSNQE